MDIVHRIGIRAPAAQVQAALATIDGLAGWWTRDTRGNAAPGGHIDFRFRGADGADVGGFGMQVLAPSPGNVDGPAVHWQVEDGPADWVGTTIDFRLSTEDGQTIVLFGHRGWREDSAFRAHCSTKWATFLLSLRSLVETGQGQPAPDDLKISNWH